MSFFLFLRNPTQNVVFAVPLKKTEPQTDFNVWRDEEICN